MTCKGQEHICLYRFHHNHQNSILVLQHCKFLPVLNILYHFHQHFQVYQWERVRAWLLAVVPHLEDRIHIMNVQNYNPEFHLHLLKYLLSNWSECKMKYLSWHQFHNHGHWDYTLRENTLEHKSMPGLSAILVLAEFYLASCLI